MAQRKIQSYQLGDTGVVPGPYTSANITVDASGRITLAANGSSGGNTIQFQQNFVDLPMSPSAVTKLNFFGSYEGGVVAYPDGPDTITVLSPTAGGPTFQSSINPSLLIPDVVPSPDGTIYTLFNDVSTGMQVILLAPTSYQYWSSGYTFTFYIVDPNNFGNVIATPSSGQILFNGTLVSSVPMIDKHTYQFYPQILSTYGGSLGIVIPGSGYVNGIYPNVPLTGGSGTGATANIEVIGGEARTAVIATIGTGYVNGEVLSTPNSNLGGSGSGFSVPIYETNANAVSQWVMNDLSDSGGGGVVEPDMQVVYGTGTGVTSDSSLTYDVGTETLTVGSTGTAVIKSFPNQDIELQSDDGTHSFTLTADGDIQIDGDSGSAGEVLTSAGPGLPPAWSPGGGGGSLWQITQYTENGGKNTVDRLWPLPIIGADRQELFSPYRTIIDSDTPVQGNEDYFLATINATAANQKAETAGVSRDGLWAGAIYDDFATQFYTPLLSYIDAEPQVGGYINKVVSMPSGFSGICFDADQDVVLIGETDEDGDPFLDSYVTVIGLNNQQLGNNTIDWQNRYQYSGFYLFPVGMGPINSISNFGISLAQAFSTGYASTTGILTKFDSTTGATQWRREISGMTNGNMSVAMNTFTSPNSKIFFSSDDTIIGLNESGSILWQRRVTLMSQFTGPYFVSQVYGLSGNNWVIAVISGADGCGLIGLNATTGATEFSVSLPDVQLEAGISVVYTGNELVVVGKYFADPNLIILVSMDAIGGYNSAKLFEFNSSGSPYTPYISGDFSPDISSGLVNNVRIGFKLQNDFNDDLSLGALLSVDADQASGTTNLSASATGLSMTVSDFTSSSPSNTATLVAGSYTIATPVGITEDNPGYTLVNPANVTTVATRLAGPLLAPLQASLEVKNGLSVGQLQLDGLLPPPVNSKGTLGDVLGMVRFDTDYIYYCYQTYTNGTPNIWSRTQVTDNGLW